MEGPVPGMVRWLPSSPCESSFLSFRTFPSASQPFWGCPCQGRPSVFLGVKTSCRWSLSQTKRLFLASSWSAVLQGAVHAPHENLRPTPTGEGGRKEGRRGTLNKTKLLATYRLPKRNAGCRSHREQLWVSCVAPWSSPWKAGGSGGVWQGGSMCMGDAGCFAPLSLCSGKEREGGILECSLNREGLQTQESLGPSA